MDAYGARFVRIAVSVPARVSAHAFFRTWARTSARSRAGERITLTAATMYQMTGFTADTAGRTIVIIGLIQGFGMGFVIEVNASFWR